MPSSLWSDSVDSPTIALHLSPEKRLFNISVRLIWLTGSFYAALTANLKFRDATVMCDGFRAPFWSFILDVMGFLFLSFFFFLNEVVRLHKCHCWLIQLHGQFRDLQSYCCGAQLKKRRLNFDICLDCLRKRLLSDLVLADKNEDRQPCRCCFL